MTDDEFRAFLGPDRLNLSLGDVARLLGANGRTVRRWYSGKQEVHRAAAALLHAMERDPSLIRALRRDYVEPVEPGNAVVDRLAWAMDRDPKLVHALRRKRLLIEARVGFVRPDGTPADPEEIEGKDEADRFRDGGAWMGRSYRYPGEVLAAARAQYLGPDADGYGVRVGVWDGRAWTFTNLDEPEGETAQAAQ